MAAVKRWETRVGWPSNGKSSAVPRFSCQRQSGYGTSVIRELIPFELGGTADLDFPPMDCAADWKSLLTGSAGPVRQATNARRLDTARPDAQ